MERLPVFTGNVHLYVFTKRIWQVAGLIMHRNRMLSWEYKDKPGIIGIMKFGSFNTSWRVLFSFTLTHLDEPGTLFIGTSEKNNAVLCTVTKINEETRLILSLGINLLSIFILVSTASSEFTQAWVCTITNPSPEKTSTMLYMHSQVAAWSYFKGKGTYMIFFYLC